MIRSIAYSLTFLALLFAQFGMARHYVVHPQHLFEAIANHAGHEKTGGDHDSPSSSKCSVCLLIKDFRVALHENEVQIAVPTDIGQQVLSTDPVLLVVSVLDAYNPRAPPVLSV